MCDVCDLNIQGFGIGPIIFYTKTHPSFFQIFFRFFFHHSFQTIATKIQEKKTKRYLITCFGTRPSLESSPPICMFLFLYSLLFIYFPLLQIILFFCSLPCIIKYKITSNDKFKNLSRNNVVRPSTDCFFT